MTSKTVYLGGPECFLPDGAAIYAAKSAACAAAGFEAKSPMDGRMPAPPLGITPTDISRLIYKANIETMRGCDFAIFDLTPFRGVSADVGTVYELGFMTGLGKPVFGYTNIVGEYIERIEPRQVVAETPPHPGMSAWRDIEGWIIEDFKNADNLMIDSAVEINGATLIRQAAKLRERLTYLGGFNLCVDQARLFFGDVPADQREK